MKELSEEAIKKALGEQASALVQEGMLIGLGSGTTTSYFIESLSTRCQAGLKISAIAASERSQELAQRGGIPLLDIDRVTHLDLTVDGADEVDPQDRMIKGGGGALVREKILAASCRQMIVIVHEKKLVPVLGKFGLPVEITPFCYPTTIIRIKKLGYDGELRYKEDGTYYLTDNGNYIFDLHTPRFFLNPEQDHARLDILPGVIDTGFFFDLPLQVLVGRKDGSVDFRKRAVNG
jgi:ribose 5-phosphate isomerase A